MNIKRILLSAVLSAGVMISSAGCSLFGGGSSASSGNIGDITFADGDKIAVIEFKDYGTVKAKLFPDIAPVGVENFIKLAEQGYYDGLKIHRVIQDTYIQGGSLNGDGTGGTAAYVGEDAAKNATTFPIEVSEKARNFYGALGYAADAYGNNSVQFYIVSNKTPADTSKISAEKVQAKADELASKLANESVAESTPEGTAETAEAAEIGRRPRIDHRFLRHVARLHAVLVDLDRPRIVGVPDVGHQPVLRLLQIELPRLGRTARKDVFAVVETDLEGLVVTCRLVDHVRERRAVVLEDTVAVGRSVGADRTVPPRAARRPEDILADLFRTDRVRVVRLVVVRMRREDPRPVELRQQLQHLVEIGLARAVESAAERDMDAQHHGARPGHVAQILFQPLELPVEKTARVGIAACRLVDNVVHRDEVDVAPREGVVDLSLIHI